ncbi:regulator of protease activity HflC (stomatin/prohibitin superfamily) [Variovorax boronicumulans]|uniref:SPFH domain-containing protein n=1 Tax=Variovorax boronicumulans TaxID=436515 RepID=UPI0027888D50|nr:SPFH domain-containing protein [Variovorax boronicumulans]MDQ0035912.1 regulator of protease activity HflC (stomatin/prohibitin superfamily) [Variovorax boronicumulans]
MFVVSLVFLFLALIGLIVGIVMPAGSRAVPRLVSMVLAAVGVIAFVFSMFTTVPASNVAVVTTFGKVGTELLGEGAHFIAPWSRTRDIYLAQQRVDAAKSEAGSKDLQSVHADLVVNFVVDPNKARELYVSNPSLSYAELLLQPATYETFKAVVAQYTAEELVTKRQEVSAAIARNLQQRMVQYHLVVQNVNLVNFGFSKSFDQAIEEKVTANQKAATAENNLKRTKFEAEQRIAQAEGEAKAIAIQAAAVEKSGGVGYVQLQAIAKWDGKLPQYVAAGSPMPFVNVK